MLTGRGWEILTGFAAAGAAVWLWRARYRPQAPCRWCGGQKKVGDRKRWRHRDCKHCGGSGERTTWGGRLMQGRRWGK